MTEAQAESRELAHHYVGVEHILLGVLREHDSVAAQTLRSLGVDKEGVRARLLGIVARGADAPPPQVPFTPRAKKVLELSLREALSHASDSVGPEHIVLGLVRRLLMAAGALALEDGRTHIDTEDVVLALTRDRWAALLLAELGVDEDAMRAAIERRGGSERPPEASTG